ncbi:hypothetical protein [Mucilaginibacter ginsenosidivorans]|uniref:Uncharacterized protein n=1 Tax=Mucilaginibacter ginsenosidivorans TaxID=398053 RepID=A0A5B8UZ06_9SPHI|nr:hypothetical protein [Mucilaginibacter ginsenosidivorans]QEC64242.1 hypothetical protein FRZ54_17205 [Mucilaginibacter ginsenosidivorans]
MKKIKRMLKLCSLALFMVLAVAGIGILGVAPTLTKDRKLFPDIELNIEKSESGDRHESQDELFKT